MGVRALNRFGLVISRFAVALSLSVYSKVSS